jgi:hypothetical protein
LEEKLKSEIVAEAPAKKWRGHLADAKWPSTQWNSAASQYVWLVARLCSASPATATSPNKILRMRSSPIG